MNARIVSQKKKENVFFGFCKKMTQFFPGRFFQADYIVNTIWQKAGQKKNHLLSQSLWTFQQWIGNTIMAHNYFNSSNFNICLSAKKNHFFSHFWTSKPLVFPQKKIEQNAFQKKTHKNQIKPTRIYLKKMVIVCRLILEIMFFFLGNPADKKKTKSHSSW